MARPSGYSPKIVKTVAEQLAKGVPLTVICNKPGMPCDDTIRNWMDKDPSVLRDIARARAVGYDTIAHRTRETARGKGESTGDVARDKLIIENDLKLLAKWNPKNYGDKITHGNDPDNPLPDGAGALEKLADAIARLSSRRPGAA